MGIKLPDIVIEGFKSEIDEILNSGNLAEGQITKYVEKTVASQVGADEGILINSCGSGIYLALMFLKDTGNYDTVFIQSNTMCGIQTLCNLTGMKVIPVKCDRLVMCPDALERALVMYAGRRIAVVYSHIGGSIDDTFSLVTDICDKYEIPLVEDCAHTYGINDKLTNSLCKVYSFYATKTASAGEGGLIVTSQPAFADWVRRFIKYDRVYMEIQIGLNFRVSEISALLIKHVIDNIGMMSANRNKTMMRYKEHCDSQQIDYHKTDFTNHNGYKFILTDLRAIFEFNTSLLTGSVFGYALKPIENGIGYSHICLDTNYDVSEDRIIATINELNRISNLPKRSDRVIGEGANILNRLLKFK